MAVSTSSLKAAVTSGATIADFASAASAFVTSVANTTALEGDHKVGLIAAARDIVALAHRSIAERAWTAAGFVGREGGEVASASAVNARIDAFAAGV